MYPDDDIEFDKGLLEAGIDLEEKSERNAALLLGAQTAAGFLKIIADTHGMEPLTLWQYGTIT